MGSDILATSAWCAALESSIRARANPAARLNVGGIIDVEEEEEEEEGGVMRERMRGNIVWK
jgi:hypothetical protein